MVLGFGSKKKKPVEEPVVRPSPSLPQLKEQRIPWPENLVDLNQVYAIDYPSPPIDRPSTGSTKVSFQSTRGPIPFHKPFRDSTDQAAPRSGNPISALFGTGVPPPPSSFSAVGARGRTATHPRTITRRAKYAPNFNVMVVGAKKTGKTSFIRLLLGTSNISPTNSAEQLATLASYRSTNVGPTASISTACVEILQSAPNRIPTTDDRIALTCIDTPGLDFSESKEFVLERAFSDILKYLDTQFAETMGEESKVVRTSKGDQHVHLCIYLIDPDSVMTPAARQARSRWAAAGLNPPKLGEGISEYDSGSDDNEEHGEEGDGGVDDDIEGEGEGNGHDCPKMEPDQEKDIDDESTDDYGEPENPPVPTTAITTTTGEDKTPRASISRESHIPSPPASPQKSQKSHKQKQPSVTSSNNNNNNDNDKEKVEFPTDGDRNRLGMSPIEVRLISRLCKRVNVLPVISRADTLTDNRLKRVKQAIRRDLQAADGAGIWGIWDAEPGTVPGRMISISNNANPNVNNNIMPSSPVSSNGNAGSTGTGAGAGDVSVAGVGGSNDDRQSRPVIKLRGPKRGLTRSRSRKSLKTAVDAEFEEPDIEASPGYPIAPITIPNIHNHHHRNYNNSIINNYGAPEEGSNMSNSRRTSAVSAKTDAAGPYGAIFSRADLRARMPFAIIAPEKERSLKQQQQQQGNGNGNGYGNGSVSENGEYHVPNVYGRFVRRFRWGTIDVLDPQHCDFAALRAAVLHSYMKSLKATTKDVLYERFRTEKLLARRATANISEEERKRMIQGQ